MVVEPPAAAFKKGLTGMGKIEIPDVAGHLFHCPEGAQIPEAHLGVGAVVFHIHRIVLAAFHNAVLVTVPTSFYPAEFESPFRPGIQGFEKGVVAGKLPVPVEFHKAAHLAVGCGLAEGTGVFKGQVDAEVHHPLVVQGVVEFHVAHGADEVSEEEGDGLFVVPDVSTGAEAAADVVPAPLESVEPSVGGPEDRLGAQGAEVEEGGFFDEVGQIGHGKGGDESVGFGFQNAELPGRLLGDVPGVAILGGVVVADASFVATTGVGVMGIPGGAVGEVWTRGRAGTGRPESPWGNLRLRVYGFQGGRPGRSRPRSRGWKCPTGS